MTTPETYLSLASRCDEWSWSDMGGFAGDAATPALALCAALLRALAEKVK